MRGAKLPVTRENKVDINSILSEDNRMSKSMNDIPMSTYGNHGRHVSDLSDSQSFTDEDYLPIFNVPTHGVHNKVTKMLFYSRTSLVRTPGDHQNAFVLSRIRINHIICIEKALKGTEIVFVLTVFVQTRFYCILFT